LVLPRFCGHRSVEEIAGWYEGIGSAPGVVTDARAQQAYVAQDVAEWQAAYEAEPARTQWVKLEREGAGEMGEVGAGGVTREEQVQEAGEVGETEAQRERVAVAAD
jgi:hypothetical protein